MLRKKKLTTIATIDKLSHHQEEKCANLTGRLNDRRAKVHDTWTPSVNLQTIEKLCSFKYDILLEK